MTFGAASETFADHGEGAPEKRGPNADRLAGFAFSETF
jgi:hypothetical protein